MRRTPAAAQPRPAADYMAFFGCMIGAAFLVICFHDRFWWPPDEGVYAYVAQRLLRGDVLHRDVQDIHFGLVHFVHALAFAVFGENLLSLRYPLAFLTVVQSALVWRLLADRGIWAASVGAIGVAALSFVQFLNPSANWYALFLALAVASALVSVSGAKRDFVVGALVMLAITVRQLSGVFIAMGALTYLIAEQRGPAPQRAGVARAVVAIMAGGLAYYLAAKASIASAIVYGPWPLALLALAWRRAAVDDRRALRLLGRMTIGAAAAAGPLLVYHLLNGSLGHWIDDVFLSALHLTSFDFFRDQRYAKFIALGLGSLIRDFSVPALVNFAFWLALLALPAALGIMVVRAARRTPASWHPLPIVAVFFSLVLLHYEIPIYLMFATGAVLSGALWIAGADHRQLRFATAATVGLAMVGLVYHAGQPLSRATLGTLRGEQMVLTASAGLPRAALAIEEHDRSTYARLLAIIAERAGPCDTVLALPLHPELNFLSERRAPFRFYSASLGLVTARDVERAAAGAAAQPPALVIHRRHDKYNTPQVLALLERIKPLYRHLEIVGEFDVLVPSSPPLDRPDCRVRGG